MKKLSLFLSIACLLLFSGCTMQNIGYFETQSPISSFEKRSDLSLAISFRLAVEDSFQIEYPKIPKTRVTEFRKSLSTALNNTFRETFNSVIWMNGFSAEGVSLVLTRAVPKWYKKSESSIGTEYGCELDYGVIVYYNGNMVKEISKKAHSRLSSLVGGGIGLIKDGVREMCIDLYKEVMNVTVQPMSGSGTGFLASNNGYIITNAHVVEGARSIEVKGIRGDFSKTHTARLIIEDQANDLALLKVDDLKLDTMLPYPLRTKGIETGEDVFVLGYPLVDAMGEEVKLTKGVVSSKTGYQGSNASYQVSAQIQPGNSGSPVFDSNGNLIGVANSKIMKAEGVTYVIKPSFIRTLFENAEIDFQSPVKNTMENLSLAEKTKILSPFIYIIKIEK